MANCKNVEITALVPWDWYSRLDPEDAAYVGRYLIGPVADLRLSHNGEHYVLNENGGRTSMWYLTIEGVSGTSWRGLDRLAQIVAKVGRITTAEARDREDGGDWENLELVPTEVTE